MSTLYKVMNKVVLVSLQSHSKAPYQCLSLIVIFSDTQALTERKSIRYAYYTFFIKF